MDEMVNVVAEPVVETLSKVAETAVTTPALQEVIASEAKKVAWNWKSFGVGGAAGLGVGGLAVWGLSKLLSPEQKAKRKEKKARKEYEKAQKKYAAAAARAATQVPPVQPQAQAQPTQEVDPNSIHPEDLNVNP